MTHWVHNLDPVIFQIAGPLAVRWYGIAYLLGFLGGYILLLRASKRGEFQVPKKELSNFIVWLAIGGVFLGGRLGYVLFYSFETFIRDPLFALRIWEGGMASHGGMIGVLLVLLCYAHRHKHSFWNLADNLAAVAPVGLFFGRVANFINGELWGRPTSVPWAVIFPQAGDAVPTPRHPSQLYEAFGEGLVLFIVLQLIRRTKWGQRNGAVSAGFLILYAAARIGAECFREPDAGYALYLDWITKGQLYSAVMVLAAISIMVAKKLYRRGVVTE